MLLLSFTLDGLLTSLIITIISSLSVAIFMTHGNISYGFRPYMQIKVSLLPICKHLCFWTMEMLIELCQQVIMSTEHFRESWFIIMLFAHLQKKKTKYKLCYSSL